MRKSLPVFALLLLALLLAAPAASADSTVELGAFSAGTPQEFFVDNISSELTSFEVSGIPAGFSVVRRGDSLYLTGTGTAAGSYSFEITGGDYMHVTCSFTVTPQVPSVTVSGPSACGVGERAEFTVSAACHDGGTLSYQWFVNTGNRSVGGSEIYGATEVCFLPDTGTPGTHYFYCEVTNTNNGQTARAVSAPMQLTVAEPGPKSISVSTMPNRTEYTVGDTLSPEGLTIRVNYADRKETIDADYSIEPMKLLTAGTQTITVSYGGKTCTFTVKVNEYKRTISVLSLPTKLTYKKGDWLDTAGMKLRITEGSKKTDVSTGFTCSPTTLSRLGRQMITVQYDDLSCEFEVTVEEAGKKDVSISVKSMPSKINYEVGESLDPTGLLLSLTTTEGTESVSSGFTCSPQSFNATGRQLVTVRYNELSCTFAVNVTEKKAEPTAEPAPAATAAPEAAATPAPTPRPTYSPTEDVGGRSHAGMIVILVFCLAALIGLSCYVIVMNNGGIQGIRKKLRHIFRR